jgi:alkanesulfonate monooxygenase SsuD/methylene tetrahydromethanopterin reductase-like flavin-dependent oxidoreductase (luciferase family)
MAHKISILGEHCDAVGRDISEIELTLGAIACIRPSVEEARTDLDARLAANHVNPENTTIGPDQLLLGPVDEVVERIEGYRRIGISTIIVEMPAPFDMETIRQLATEVRPRLMRESAPATPATDYAPPS